jgi:hypothetical protein
MEKALRLGPVEKNPAQTRRAANQAENIVRRGIANISIGTSSPAAARDDIPHRHARGLEAPDAIGIRHIESCAEKPPHDWPKGISRMRIVLAAPERLYAGHRAENQTLGILPKDWRERG